MENFNPQLLEVIRSEIAVGIKQNVNGKLDRMQEGLDTHNLKHENDMQRMMPIIESYEEGKRDIESAQKAGKIVLWLAASTTAIGGAYLVVRNILS